MNRTIGWLLLLLSSPGLAAETVPEKVCAEDLSLGQVEWNGCGDGVELLPRFEGLSRIQEQDLWALLKLSSGVPDSSRTLSHASSLLARSGLFSSITPAVECEKTPKVWTWKVVEAPTVQNVRFSGADDFSPSTLLEVLTSQPDACTLEPTIASRVWGHDGSKFQPGIARMGLAAAMERLTQFLWNKGYWLSTLSAQFSPDGTLTIAIDLGRIQKLEFRGLTPDVEKRVREVMKVSEGDIFLADELASQLEFAQSKVTTLMFVAPQGKNRLPPRIEEVNLPEGGSRFQQTELSEEVKPKDKAPPVKSTAAAPMSFVDSLSLENDEQFDQREWQLTLFRTLFPFLQKPSGVSARSHVTVHQGVVTIHAQAKSQFGLGFSLTADQFVRLTPVTGYAPSMRILGSIQNPSDTVRALGSVRSFLLTNEYNVSLALRFPTFRIAELGVQALQMYDTHDHWRMGPLASYTAMALTQTPNADYFYRRGILGFLTTQLTDSLLLGLEYRHEDNQSASNLRAFSRILHQNSAITDGRFSSVLLRLEWVSEPFEMRDIASENRNSETSLLASRFSSRKTLFHLVNTLEVANSALGPSDFQFLRLVSDNKAQFAMPWSFMKQPQLLRLRMRLAGGNNLPIQKTEALGGFDALRGYDFKQFPGQASALGTVEYDFAGLFLFADVGTVLQDGKWMAPKAGLGMGVTILDFVRYQLALPSDFSGFQQFIMLGHTF